MRAFIVAQGWSKLKAGNMLRLTAEEQRSLVPKLLAWQRERERQRLEEVRRAAQRSAACCETPPQRAGVQSADGGRACGMRKKSENARRA